MVRLATSALAAGLVLLMGSCGILGYHEEPVEIVLRGPTFELVWDEPATANRSSLTAVSGYELFYRAYPAGNAVGWLPLALVRGSDGLQCVITSDQLPTGRYELAVRTIYANGTRSDYHSSTQSTADPPSGWYIFWIGGP